MEAALNARMASFKDRIGATRPTPVMPILETPPKPPVMPTPIPTPILETPPVQYKKGGLSAMPKGKC